MRRGERERSPYFGGQETTAEEVSKIVTKVEHSYLPMSGSIDTPADSPDFYLKGSDKTVKPVQSDASVEDVFSGKFDLVETQNVIEKIIEQNSSDE